MVKKSNVLILQSKAVPKEFVKSLELVFNDNPTHRLIVIDEGRIRGEFSIKRRDFTLRVLHKMTLVMKVVARIKALRKTDKVKDTRGAEKEGKTLGNMRMVRNAILRFEPESILCASSSDLNLVLRTRKFCAFDANIIAISPFFTLDYSFFDMSVDAFVVENAECKSAMSKLGFPADKIHVCGFPVGVTIPAPEEVALLRTSLGLPMSPSVYLGVGDHFTRDFFDVFNMLLDQGEVINLAVPPLADANSTKLLRKSMDVKKATGCKLLTAGENAMNYLFASDIVVTAYDPVLIYEALLLQKPVIAFAPANETEKQDLNYLAKKGVVCYAEENPDVVLGIYKCLEKRLETAIDETVTPCGGKEAETIRAIIESFRPPISEEE